MPAPRFRDDRWDRIYEVLLAFPGLYIRQEASARRFVENVLWVARAGCAWRLLPEEYGAWNSVYKRFARWQEKGVWQALLKDLSGDADLEWLMSWSAGAKRRRSGMTSPTFEASPLQVGMLDSTAVRAHACAAGAKKTKEIRLLAALLAAFPAHCKPPPNGMRSCAMSVRTARLMRPTANG